MKKPLIMSLVFIGTLALAGVASASTAEILQPASTITYNEELVVNNTARFNSIYVGKQDEGGVTYFNGTIVNSTTNNGANNPVTFGDDVRIDGEIYRTEKGGDPLKISDSVIPTEGDANNFGSSSNRWKSIYAQYLDVPDVFVETIGVTDVIYNAYGGNNPVVIDSVLKIRPNILEPYECNEDRKGEIYFLDGINNFYGCTGSSWEQLNN